MSEERKRRRGAALRRDNRYATTRTEADPDFEPLPDDPRTIYLDGARFQRPLVGKHAKAPGQLELFHSDRMSP